MNITTKITGYKDIYDAIQTGEIDGLKMGDTINGAFMMVNSYHLVPIPDEGSPPLAIYTALYYNSSTKTHFTEEWVGNQDPTSPKHMAHIELISFNVTPFPTN